MKIENLKKVLAELVEAGNIAGEMASMKGVMWYKRLPSILKILDESMELLSVNWEDLPKEMAELDSEDEMELKNFFMEKFNIPQDQVEVKIESAFKLLVDSQVYIKALIEFAKSLKK